MKNEHDNSNNRKRKSRTGNASTNSSTDNSSGQFASTGTSDGVSNSSDNIANEQSRRAFIEQNPEFGRTSEFTGNGERRTGGRNNDSGTGARTDSRTGTGAEETPNDADEIPVRVTKRRGRKPGSKNKTASAFEQATLISFIAIGLDAIYGSIALFAGAHWELSDDEASLLSQSVDTALKTLPEQYYADVKQNIEKFIPWIGLAITAGSITIPRIQLTNKLRVEKATVTYSDTNTQEYRQPAAHSDFANGGTNDYGL